MFQGHPMSDLPSGSFLAQLWGTLVSVAYGQIMLGVSKIKRPVVNGTKEP